MPAFEVKSFKKSLCNLSYDGQKPVMLPVWSNLVQTAAQSLEKDIH